MILTGTRYLYIIQEHHSPLTSTLSAADSEAVALLLKKINNNAFRSTLHHLNNHTGEVKYLKKVVTQVQARIQIHTQLLILFSHIKNNDNETCIFCIALC